MYDRILRALLENHRAGGVVARLLSGRADRAVHDAVPLRLLGAVHLAVLSGNMPRLAAHYPSVGGHPGEGLEEDFLDALAEMEHGVRPHLDRQVQTNEVGRSIVPLVLANWLGSQGVTDIDWLEVGASAGLNLCFQRYAADTGEGLLGDPAARVRFGVDWFAAPPPVSVASPVVRRIEGYDPYPVDLRSEDEALRLTAFVWPDQTERLARLQAAIATAREEGVRVMRGSAEEAVRLFARGGLERTTVVFHSIVWQYLGDDVQRLFREELVSASRHAGESRKLVWARMEPAGPVADVQVDVWDGSDSVRHERLATVGYHGRGLQWLGLSR